MIGRLPLALGRFGAALLACLRLPAAEERPVACATAESMVRVMEAWTGVYNEGNSEPQARVALRCKFSAEAFDALLAGQIDVAPFARELFPSEKARYIKDKGIEPLLIPVATGSRDTKGGTHAIAIYVSAKNPLSRLSLPQLRSVLTGRAGGRTWGELGQAGSRAGHKITVHGMVRRRDTGNPPGVVNYIEQRVLDGSPWRADLVEHIDIPGGAQALALIVQAVAADEDAIGYSGFGYAVPGTKTLALSETEGGPAYAGTKEDVLMRRYPLSRTIYLCIDPASRAAVREFAALILSERGQALAGGAPENFFPLPRNSVAEARRSLTAAPGGQTRD